MTIYLVAIRVVQGNAPGLVLKAFALVLEDFIEMIHVDFSRRLPPRHKVDHAIELVEVLNFW